MLSSLQGAVGVVPKGINSWDWAHAGIILAATAVIAVAARRGTARAFHGDTERAAVRLTGRFLAYLIISAGLVYALEAVKVQIAPLIGALGIGGIALAFALQDILQNLVAGIILQARRPIRRGDTVEVGSYQGVVRDIDLRTVLVRTPDGLDVYVPNKTVLENPIVNYTMTPTRRLELTVGVGYRSDLETAQRLMIAAVRRVEGVLPQPAPAAWVTDFGESTVDFSVQFWFEVAETNIWKVRSDAAVAIKHAVDRAGIELPFAQRTLSLDPALAQLLAPASDGSGAPEPPDGSSGANADSSEALELDEAETRDSAVSSQETPGRPGHHEHRWGGVFHR